MVINEEKIRRIVSEVLGLAKQVINIVNKIENKIIKIYDSNTTDNAINEIFYVNDLKVDFKHLFVENTDMLSSLYLENGYDYNTNTMVLTNVSVKGCEINL